MNDRSLLLCLSHLRWDFVYQRPQHLISRFAAEMPVVYFEEPVPSPDAPRLEQREALPGLTIAVPHLPPEQCRSGHPEGIAHQREMLDRLLSDRGVARPNLWYYTPMALEFSEHLDAELMVFDCMDELSGFRFAPTDLVERERQLLARSDVVFTGGRSLYEAKRRHHANVHAFPSGVDIAHFSRARNPLTEPTDQQSISHPRVGYYGVIDERLDYALIAAVAKLRPDYQWIFVGPIAKVDPADLPQAANIHYLGPKKYEELPGYLAGWDVAMMPFAINEATTYISPTKTPEYLAGGKAVISTAIADVLKTYDDSGLVSIAGNPEEFARAADARLSRPLAVEELATQVDPLLAEMSWDGVFKGMRSRMDAARLDRANRGPLPLATQPHRENGANTLSAGVAS